MRHFTSPSFWDCYDNLPDEIKEIAGKNFELLKRGPRHPSLHLKKIKNFRSVRIGRKYGALGIEIKMVLSGSGSANIQITKSL